MNSPHFATSCTGCTRQADDDVAAATVAGGRDRPSATGVVWVLRFGSRAQRRLMPGRVLATRRGKVGERLRGHDLGAEQQRHPRCGAPNAPRDPRWLPLSRTTSHPRLSKRPRRGFCSGAAVSRCASPQPQCSGGDIVRTRRQPAQTRWRSDSRRSGKARSVSEGFCSHPGGGRSRDGRRVRFTHP